MANVGFLRTPLRPYHHFRTGEQIKDSAGRLYLVEAVRRSILQHEPDVYRIVTLFTDEDSRAHRAIELDEDSAHDGRYMRAEGGLRFIPPAEPVGPCIDENGHTPFGWTGQQTCETCGADMGFCVTTARWYDLSRRRRKARVTRIHPPRSPAPYRTTSLTR